jgi:S-methylmethionine-dependent homocysteine/selenocysteine methylase
LPAPRGQLPAAEFCFDLDGTRLKNSVPVRDDMSKYRSQLPQLSGGPFITDGGIETTLIFLEGFDLPSFAAFVLLESEPGTKALENYFRQYADLARKYGTGLILESPTWRTSSDWGTKLGYNQEALADINRRAIKLLVDIRSDYETEKTQVVISGCVGPRGDGYRPSSKMSADEAQDYHSKQIEVFRNSEADMITGLTINYVEEAIGIAQAARSAKTPSVISFTVETDGRLPSGESIETAIETVDAATQAAPAYYMVNCAHPTHFQNELKAGRPWVARIRGIRANASRKSHAELDEAQDLDAGDPHELAAHYRVLVDRVPTLNVLGGCCGTDHRHIEEICKATLR